MGTFKPATKVFILCLFFISSSGFLNINQNLIINCEASDFPETVINVFWNITYEMPNADTAKSIARSNTAGYAIAGFTNSTGNDDQDILFMRIAPDGTYLWNRTFGDVNEDKGYQVIAYQAGGYVIASTYENVSALHNNTDFLVTRLAENGAVLWNISYSGPNQDHVSSFIGDLGRSIAECTNGDLVCAGVSSGVDISDVWLFRLAPDGTLLWENTFHNRDIERCFAPDSVVECQDGGFAVLGYTYSAATSNDVWLIKTDSNGNEIWNQTYGDDAGYQRPEALVECSDGGFGIIANTHSFGAGGADAWIIRTDSLGNQIWNQTYGGSLEEGGGYILEMPDGGFTIAGSTHSFDVGNGDAWLVRTNGTGTIIWNHTVGDPYGNGACAFVYEGNNTYVVAGSTHRVGESFGEIWLFKARVEVVPTTPTPSTTETNSLPGFLSIVGILALTTVIIRFHKRKLYYYER
ncbi:MAG: hypothetical protein FK733_11660 [Asgard group archaeon]|nr:hypothetical protein [Asgard group archaeon]